MSPSRRQFLRTTALSLTGLTGCSSISESSTTETTADTAESRDRPEPATATMSATHETTEREQPTTDTATEHPPSFDCDSGATAGWGLPDGGTGRLNYAPEASGPTERPSTVWTASGGESSDGAVEFTRPVVADGRVYVGRGIYSYPSTRQPEAHHVDAYDAASGERVWRTQIRGLPQSPARASDYLLVPTNPRTTEARLYALDPATGKRAWTYLPDGALREALPTEDGILVSVEDDSGAYLHVVGTDGDRRSRVSIPRYHVSHLTWCDGRAYLCSRNGTVVAIDTAAAELAWLQHVSDGDGPTTRTLAATPCAVVAAVEGALHVLSIDGTVVWSSESGVEYVATDGEAIYGFGGNNLGSGYALADGMKTWAETDDRAHVQSVFEPPAFDGQTLYTGEHDGALVAVSAADGERRWSLDATGGTYGSQKPVLVDDTLYIAWSNRLLALR